MKTSFDVFYGLGFGFLIGCFILMNYIFINKKRDNLLHQNQYETVLAALSAGYCRLDANGLICSASKGICELFGCTEDQLVGRNFIDWLSDKAECQVRLPEIHADFANKPHAKSCVDYELCDGETLSLEICIIPAKGTKTNEYYAVIQNVTHTKKLERTLQYRKEQAKKLFDMIPDVISFKDSNGRWEIANLAKIHLFKLDEIEYQGKTDAQLVSEAKVSKEALIQSHISDGTAWDAGSRIRLEEVIPTGNSERIFDVIKIPIHNEDGSKRGILEVGRDITDRVRAQIQLKESEERYRSLIEHHSSAVFSFNMRGRITMVNATCANLMGFSEGEMVGSPFSRLLVREDAIKVLQHVQQILRGIPGEKIYRCINKQGSIVEVLVVLIPITINRHIVGLYAVAKDVTIQNRLQRENDWLNRQNELILNSAGEGIYGIDINGRITFCNPAAARMLGWKVHELIGKCINEIVRSLSIRCRDGCIQGDCVIRETLLKGKNYGLHHDEFSRKDGTDFQVEYVATPIVRDGGVVGGVVAFRDITEQYQMRKQFEELNKQYQLIFDSAGEGICLTGPDGNVLLCNPAMLRMIGYEKDELVGHSLHEFVHPYKRDCSVDSVDQCLLLQAMKSGRSCRETNEIFWRKDGTGFFVEYVMTPITVDGKTNGFVLIVQDVTIRKEAEEMLLKSAKLSVVGQLAAGVAHEIRNPLTALKGFIQLLREENSAREMYFSIMQSELERIEAIVNEFLILAKPHKVSFKPRDLSACVNGVIDLLKTQATLHNIQIRANMNNEMPLIECDENRLKQVFVNLLKNAIEAMPTGGVVQIETGIESSDNDDHANHAFVRISDEGQGIPKDILPNLGEPFYSTKEKGTGLGLMVSHKIIESHQGTMRIDSEVGKGTIVEIRLPFSHPEEHDEDMHLLERAFRSRLAGKL